MRFDPSAHSLRGQHPLVVVFLDLTGFAKQTTRVSDAELAEHIEGYYALVAARVVAGGGYVVKFIGDGVLVVFHREAADQAVAVLLELKRELDDWLAAIGWDCRLTAKVHVGDVIVGPFGGNST
jgi:adenylate cyclase